MCDQADLVNTLFALYYPFSYYFKGALSWEGIVWFVSWLMTFYFSVNTHQMS